MSYDPASIGTTNRGASFDLRDGAVVIAAITSCTSTLAFVIRLSTDISCVTFMLAS